jgi:hypothetical protein
MLIWVLTAIDIVTLLNLSFSQFGVFYYRHLLLVSGFYLIGKGVIFRDFMSVVDGVCGLYILLVYLIGFTSFFYYLILAWFIYKLITLFLM